MGWEVYNQAHFYVLFCWLDKYYKGKYNMTVTISGGITMNGGGFTFTPSGGGGGGGTQKAIFGYGNNSGTYQSKTNLVSNTGVVATDTTGVGTARMELAAAGYGSDKAIFGYGTTNGSLGQSMTNLVSNTGVVATDTTGVGTARNALAAASYGYTA